jgi:Zn-dependent protease with chaperone function
MFSSSILEAFSAAEIRFVMGHELGHHLFHHHDIPIGFVLRGQQRPSPKLALMLTSWSRYAEISADRAGAYCARDIEAVAHSLFKLALLTSSSRWMRCNSSVRIQDRVRRRKTGSSPIHSVHCA